MKQNNIIIIYIYYVCFSVSIYIRARVKQANQPQAVAMVEKISQAIRLETVAQPFPVVSFSRKWEAGLCGPGFLKQNKALAGGN
jgi:hypothetical protein